jgi:hypothetical protein
MALNNFIQITYSNIKADIETFLRNEHNKGNILYSPASPYGQILSVLENLHQLSFLYLKNAINQFDLGDNNSINERIIRNAAIFAGHNPGRAISATGTLRLTLKSNVDLGTDIPGGRVVIINRTRIKNITNSLSYILNIGTERVSHKITPNYQFFLPIIQGEWVQNTRTGDGTSLQTFNFSESANQDVENFNVEVLVNGVYWSIKKHIWEMIPDENACVVRTGFNGGIDVVFGNSGFGAIPPIGSVIQINYLKTNGSNGNIFRRTRNDWKFVEDVFDGNGDTLDITKVFDVDIYTDINFGADKEDLMFTKNILPIASNNFVLGLPQQYAYEIKKLGVFSHVNAYEQTGTIFIVATPNIKLFKSPDSDYFTIDIAAFSLDAYEISKIDTYLKAGGNLQLTKKYRIKSPDLSYYVMNVYVMSYSDALDDSVNSQILQAISDYFLNLTRIDRIPKLDLIRALSSIQDIHSVDIQIISKKNEDYHTQAMTDAQNKLNMYNSSYQTDISISNMNPDYSYSDVKGLDPILGDIIFEPNEIPIIRGGWFDRNGVYYSDDIDGNGLKSVNIIKKGTIDAKNRPAV